jgi:hypothetical protein
MTISAKHFEILARQKPQGENMRSRKTRKTVTVKAENPRRVPREKMVLAIKARERELPVCTDRASLIAAGIVKAGS